MHRCYYVHTYILILWGWHWSHRSMDLAANWHGIHLSFIINIYYGIHLAANWHGIHCTAVCRCKQLSELYNSVAPTPAPAQGKNLCSLIFTMSQSTIRRGLNQATTSQAAHLRHCTYTNGAPMGAQNNPACTYIRAHSATAFMRSYSWKEG